MELSVNQEEWVTEVLGRNGAVRIVPQQQLLGVKTQSLNGYTIFL